MILMYEDEAAFIEDYIEVIQENGYQIEIFKDADGFLKKVRESYHEIKLMIIDIMVFGPGNEFSRRSTDGGMASGLGLIDELENIEKEKGISKPIRKIVFSNRTGTVFEEIKKDKRIWKAIRKSDYVPSEFLDIVKEAIQNASI